MSGCVVDAPESVPGLSDFTIVEFEATPFVYLEARGPFQQTAPKVWGELHGILGKGEAVGDKKKVMAGLSMCEEGVEGDDKFVYQAGLFLNNELDKPIEGLLTRQVSAGRFAKFLLTGSYMKLSKAFPSASSQVVRAGHSIKKNVFFMENYLNTYGTVPEEELLTEIYVPIEEKEEEVTTATTTATTTAVVQAVQGLSTCEVVHFEETPFLYLEARGPFMTTAPKVWRDLMTTTKEFESVIGAKRKAQAGLTLIDETKEGDDRYIYQAGILLNEELSEEMTGLHKRRVPAGKFGKFRLTGSHTQLPAAYPSAVDQVKQAGEAIRGDTFFMEVYLNTYGTVPEADLLTDIYVPLL